MIAQGRAGSRRGSTLVEFALMGVSTVLISISVFECCIGMFQYLSMANAVAVATRYAANHGATCGTPNSCTITVATVATMIGSLAPIATASQLNLSLTDNSGTTTCALSTCQTYTSQQFPGSTSGANAVGNPITLKLTYAINNPIPLSSSGSFTLGAQSTQVIQF